MKFFSMPPDMSMKSDFHENFLSGKFWLDYDLLIQREAATFVQFFHFTVKYCY